MREPILVLGKYEILETVGSGGMATVYRARVSGPMGFEKAAAVKVLQDDAAEDDELVRMFIDEARLGAKLAHQNIAQVLDFGESGGRYWLAMEFVDGLSLSALIKRLNKAKKPVRIPVHTAVWVACQVLSALDYAHELRDEAGKPLGVIHRDVSPQNILLDRGGAVKLCDFGIATGTFRGEKTRTGIIKGKAAFMAPEQALGKKMDRRLDQYATALTIVAMMTGGAPYDGKDTGEIRASATGGFPIDKLDKLDCPEAFKDVLAKALALDPKQRFATADEFAVALRSAVPDSERSGRVALVGLVDRAIGDGVQGPGRTGARSNGQAPARSRKNGGQKPGRKNVTKAPAKGDEHQDYAGGYRFVVLALLAMGLTALVLALLGVDLPTQVP